MDFTAIHRDEQDRMLRALEVLRVFERHAVQGLPPERFDADVAPILGRGPGQKPAPDELWQLALGLLHLARMLTYEVVTGEGGIPEQVLVRCQRKIESAPLVD